MATSSSSGSKQPVVVLLVGHSYVKRMVDFMEADRARRNLAYAPDDVQVRWSTYGGAFLRPGDKNRSILNLLSDGLRCRPTIVFLHIGENDVGDMKPEQISGAISALSFYVASVCPSVKAFLCGELFPFPKFQEQFAKEPAAVVGPVNTALSAAIDIQSTSPLPGSMVVKFWHHEIGIYKGNANLFRADRVHLNDEGMDRYWRSVRAAVGFALNCIK